MSGKTSTSHAAVETRIRRFYDLLSQGRFARCYLMIDPLLRHDPNSVTLYQYMEALGAFRERFGTISVQQVHVQLHLDERNKRFQDRDFAIGKTVWRDHQGQEHTFLERWVKNGRYWYTVCTGFVTLGREATRPA
jgi:hypothetical protein